MKKFTMNCLAFAFLLTVSSFSSILSAVTLTANKLYISEQEPNDQLLQLDCSGFEYKYNRQVLFFANGQQIFDSITNTTDFDGITQRNGTSIALHLNYTKVGGVRNAYCSEAGVNSTTLPTIPFVSRPHLLISPEKFKVDQNFNVTCSVKVFPTSTTDFSVTFSKGGKQFSSWSREKVTDTKWVWKNETAIAGGLAAAGPQPLPFSVIVTPKTKAASGKWSCSVVLAKKGKDQKTDVTFTSEEFNNSGAFSSSLSVTSIVFIVAAAFLSSLMR